MRTKKKIVAICWYKVFPAVTGGQKGIADFYSELAKTHNTTLICSSDNENPRNNISLLPILPTSKLQVLNPFNYITIIKIITDLKPDVLIIEHPYYALLANWCKTNEIAFIVHTHNIEYQRMKLLGKLYWSLVKFIEKYAYQNADKIWCKTNEDKQTILQWTNIESENIQILPYGINEPNLKYSQEEARQRLQIATTKKVFLFAASFDYKPNIDALLHLHDDILPLLNDNIIVLICGKLSDSFNELNSDKLRICGLVEDLGLYYAAADGVINPVRIGAGVQTKTTEAIAHKKAVICYKHMTNGIPKTWLNRNVFTAKNTVDFVRLTNTVIDNNQISWVDNDLITWEKIVSELKLTL